MKRKNPVVWAGRGTGFNKDLVTLNGNKPPFVTHLVGQGEWYGKRFLKTVCYRQFSRVTGLKLKPGECKAIRFSVEVVKP